MCNINLCGKIVLFKLRPQFHNKCHFLIVFQFTIFPFNLFRAVQDFHGTKWFATEIQRKHFHLTCQQSRLVWQLSNEIRPMVWQVRRIEKWRQFFECDIEFVGGFDECLFNVTFQICIYGNYVNLQM